jgi:HSP20 family protein
MALSKWSPMSISSFFDDEFDFPAFNSSRNLATGLNIYETDSHVIAEMAMPGVSEDKVDISMDGRMVTISSHIEEKKEEKDKKRYFVSSMSSRFNYSFRLPDTVSGEEPEATLADGILTVRFLKRISDAPKKIKVTKK